MSTRPFARNNEPIKANSISNPMSNSPSQNNSLLPNPEALVEKARNASAQLKAMAHENRLAILFHLYEGPKSVHELEELLNMRQPAVSQQLARLRADNMVATERRGKQVYYSIVSQDAKVIVELLCKLYCHD